MRWVKQILRKTFWAFVIVGDTFVLVFFLSLVANSNSVLYWLMDTIGSVLPRLGL